MSGPSGYLEDDSTDPPTVLRLADDYPHSWTMPYTQNIDLVTSTRFRGACTSLQRFSATAVLCCLHPVLAINLRVECRAKRWRSTQCRARSPSTPAASPGRAGRTAASYAQALPRFGLCWRPRISFRKVRAAVQETPLEEFNDYRTVPCPIDLSRTRFCSLPFIQIHRRL
eukprot:COSAG04_NODE_1484_length_6561_cov_1.862272_8_plen_170_part_00